MNKVKSIIAVLLLVVITVVVVFGPHIVKGQSDKKLTEEKISWNYSNQSAAKITDRQVAMLYYNGEINARAYLDFNEQSYDETKIKDNVTAMLDIVFASNETVRLCIKEIVYKNSIKYTQSGVLTMIDNRPVVLNYAYAAVDTAYGTFEFNFEQKTQTLVSFSYYSDNPLDYTNSITSENLEAALNDYYKNRLGLSDEQFIYQYETMEKNDFKDYFVYAAIQVYPQEVEIGDQITDYTF